MNKLTLKSLDLLYELEFLFSSRLPPVIHNLATEPSTALCLSSNSNVIFTVKSTLYGIATPRRTTITRLLKID
jgi:hypothetical protein